MVTSRCRTHALGFRNCSSWTLEHRLNSCVHRFICSAAFRTESRTGSGSRTEHLSLALEGEFFTIELPGKPYFFLLSFVLPWEAGLMKHWYN